MKIRGVAALGCLTAAMAMGVAACGGDDEESGGGSAQEGGGGKTLNVYSSLPLQGASRPQSEDVINGIKLALKQKGGKCGDFTIKYTSLDDATAAAGKWEAGADVGQRAQGRAGRQRDRLLGEFNSGASAISIPITNEAGILQVSPSNTAVRPDQEGVGAEPGEPDKYYPTGERTYGRVVPIDTIQGAAQAQYMKDEGVTSVYILDDAEVYGKGVAEEHARHSAEKQGIKIAGEDSWDGKASNYRALASKIKDSGADAVFTGGIIDNNGPQLYKDLQRRHAGRQAVRPRRRRDRGHDQGAPGRSPEADVHDRADGVAGRASGRRARSSTRTTRPSTASRRTRSTRTRSTATRRCRSSATRSPRAATIARP